MYRGKSKLLPIILMVLVAVVAIIAMVSLGRALLGRGDRAQVADDSVSRALLTAEIDRAVRMNVRGPIVADEDFRSYEIEITPSSRRMTTYRGYQNEVIDNTQLGNSTVAYIEFVNALSRANFAERAPAALEPETVEGLCAGGRLFTFDVMQAQSVVDESWIASCRNAPSTFRGDAVTARDLFLAQIPNSAELLRDFGR
jgi:hypothetical protein